MPAILSFKDLVVWQKSMALVKLVYGVTASLPVHERFGLSAQLQRAAVSIPSNISEGSKRGTRADFRQFCKIALGSAAEVETQLIIVSELYPQIVTQEASELVQEIQKMVSTLSNRLASKL